MPGVHRSHRINGNLKFLCMCDDRSFDRIIVTIYYDSWICINFLCIENFNYQLYFFDGKVASR